MYGNTIKYVIPLFTPSAMLTSPPSTTALHIAHCALLIVEIKSNVITEMNVFNFLYIIR